MPQATNAPDEVTSVPSPPPHDKPADSLMSLLEPLLIVFLGGAVGFIVISLFMPLVSLITNLSQ